MSSGLGSSIIQGVFIVSGAAIGIVGTSITQSRNDRETRRQAAEARIEQRESDRASRQHLLQLDLLRRIPEVLREHARRTRAILHEMRDEVRQNGDMWVEDRTFWADQNVLLANLTIEVLNDPLRLTLTEYREKCELYVVPPPNESELDGSQRIQLCEERWAAVGDLLTPLQQILGDELRAELAR